MDSLIKHIEINAAKYNSSNIDLNVRIVKVGKEINKIILTNYIISQPHPPKGGCLPMNS